MAERLCLLSELVDGSPRRFDVGGTAIAVVRIGGEVHAIGDTCSHADVSLAEGEFDAATCELECWKHGSTFSLTTGEPSCLPAIKAVPVYPVAIVDGEVRVTIGEDL